MSLAGFLLEDNLYTKSYYARSLHVTDLFGCTSHVLCGTGTRDRFLLLLHFVIKRMDVITISHPLFLINIISL